MTSYMETDNEARTLWKKLVWAIVIVALLATLVVFWVMRNRVSQNAYFGNLNNYENIN